MAVKPASHIDWTDGAPAKVVEPSAAKKLLGWTALERPPFEFMNFLFFRLDEWVKWSEAEIDAIVAGGLEFDAVIAPTGTHSDFNDLMADADIANIKRILVATPLTLTTTQTIDEDDKEFIFKPDAVMTPSSLAVGFQITANKIRFVGGRFTGFNNASDIAIQITNTAKNALITQGYFFDNDTDIDDQGSNSTLVANVVEVP